MNKKELIHAAFQKIVSGNEDQLFLAARDLKKAKIESGYSQNTEIDFYLLLVEYLSGTNNSSDDINNFFLNKVKTNNHNNLRMLIENKDVRVDGSSRITSFDFDYDIEDIIKTLPQLWLKSLKYDAIVAQVHELEAGTAIEREKLDRIKDIIGELPVEEKK